MSWEELDLLSAELDASPFGWVAQKWSVSEPQWMVALLDPAEPANARQPERITGETLRECMEGAVEQARSLELARSVAAREA